MEINNDCIYKMDTKTTEVGQGSLLLREEYRLDATCVSSMSRTLRTAELVPIIINVFVDLSTLATIASEVALISAVKV